MQYDNELFESTNLAFAYRKASGLEPKSGSPERKAGVLTTHQDSCWCGTPTGYVCGAIQSPISCGM